MKIAPIIRAIHQSPITSHQSPIIHLLVHTGQHYDYEMSRVFFENLELPEPDFHLGVGSGTHAEQTGRIMIELEKVLFKEKPDTVVVVGDVNSTLAGALAAVKLHIPVAHVEAGLRSFDRQMPEEINRLLTDAISDYLFTPSPDADENLKKEGVPPEKILLVGNVMVDSLLHNKPKAEKSDILERLGLVTSHESPFTNHQLLITIHQSPITPYALLTLHRPSSVDEKESLLRIIKAIKEISLRIPVVFPVHPRTQQRLKEFNLLNQSPITNHQLLLIEPLGYLDFLCLMMNAKFVITDSGGIQVETTILNIPCLTLRDATEWGITLSQGSNIVVGNNSQRLVEEALKILDGKGKKGNCPEMWDGRVADRMVEVLARGG